MHNLSDFFLKNLGACRPKERFHHIRDGKRYQEQCNINIMGDDCWSLYSEEQNAQTSEEKLCKKYESKKYKKIST